MPFEDLPDRIARIRNSFGIVIDIKGRISLYFPVGHPLCNAKRIKTQVGVGDDAGLIKLIPSIDDGRAIYTNNNKKGWCIKYATLPGAPTSKLPIVNIKSKDLENNIVQLIMPWYKEPAPRFDTADRLVSTQTQTPPSATPLKSGSLPPAHKSIFDHRR
jgi:hypothetical protein